MVKIKNHDILSMGMYIIYIDVTRIPVDSFRCAQNTSQFNKELIENYIEGSVEGYFLEVDV